MRRIRRAHLLAAFLLAATAIFVLAFPGAPEVENGAPEVAAGENIAALILEGKTPKPYDQPDAAEDFFLRQRVPRGAGPGEVNLYETYREADRHIDRMPIVSSRFGREISAGDAAFEKAALGRWEPLGPGNIGGRTRAYVLHPGDPDIRYAAGVTGGIWKTVDGGASWRILDDKMISIAVGSLVIDPRDPSTLYAGTGEGVFTSARSRRGAGIFVTKDSGETWSQLKSTFTRHFRHVNDIVLSPRDSRRIYAATRTGVWRSTNAGQNWTRILNPRTRNGCFDLAIRTDRPNDNLLAACGNFGQAIVFRSTGANAPNATFEESLRETGMGRTSLAIAPSDENIVYALAASFVPGPDENFEDGLFAVFRSDRGGEPGSWVATVRNTDSTKLHTLLLSNPVVASLEECNVADGENDYFNQGWYDNVIAVDPVDPDIVFTGGIDLFRSDDGGRTWGLISYWWVSPSSAHADHHAIVFHPDYNGTTNQIMWSANDGGVYETTNARARAATGTEASCSPSNTQVRWRDLNNGYGVTQFYHGAVFPDGRSYVGGTQDNGTLLGEDRFGPDAWREVFGGDGGYVAIVPEDPEIYYVETTRLSLRKRFRTGQGFDFHDVTDGITEPDDNFLFIAPYVMDARKSDRLYIGGRTLWRTTNGAEHWLQASAPLTNEDEPVSAIAISPRNPNRVLVGMSDGFIYRNDKALQGDATTEWPGVRLREGFISWLAFDPTDQNVAYAASTTLTGRHFYQTLDGGRTWRPMEGAGATRLPPVPVTSIVVDPRDPRRIYVGTDRGVFVSTDRGNRWAVESVGLPRTIVESLAISESGNRRELFAFTHGRGVWKTEIGR